MENARSIPSLGITESCDAGSLARRAQSHIYARLSLLVDKTSPLSSIERSTKLDRRMERILSLARRSVR